MDGNPVIYYKSPQDTGRHERNEMKLLDRKPLTNFMNAKIFKMKRKKFLTEWRSCDTINESLEAKPFKRKQASKDKVVLWKLNNATWIICDSSQMLLKHRLIMNISNRQFLYWASFWSSGQKRFLEPIKVLHNFMESLILAQDERWRRA